MQQAIENARKQAAQPAPPPGFLEKTEMVLGLKQHRTIKAAVP